MKKSEGVCCSSSFPFIEQTLQNNLACSNTHCQPNTSNYCLDFFIIKMQIHNNDDKRDFSKKKSRQSSIQKNWWPFLVEVLRLPPKEDDNNDIYD